jgi:hypothetical protein
LEEGASLQAAATDVSSLFTWPAHGVSGDDEMITKEMEPLIFDEGIRLRAAATDVSSLFTWPAHDVSGDDERITKEMEPLISTRKKGKSDCTDYHKFTGLNDFSLPVIN